MFVSHGYLLMAFLMNSLTAFDPCTLKPNSHKITDFIEDVVS